MIALIAVFRNEANISSRGLQRALDDLQGDRVVAGSVADAWHFAVVCERDGAIRLP